MAERRKWTRFLLRVTGRPAYLCAVLIAQGVSLDCALMDISCGGARLRVRDQVPLPQLVDGQGIEFLSLDAPRLAFLKDKRGIVAWYRPAEREFGVSFNEMLRKGQVEGLLEG